MANLDPRIIVIRDKYGLQDSDFWELKQKKGTWVAKHSALEVAAVKAGIEFDNPTIVEAKTEAGIAAVCVAGSIPDGDGVMRREWSIGEANPKNNMNAYPWAMAEKRAKDRVILKLIGIHGLVYSEDELSDAGDERPPRQDAAPRQQSRHDEQPTEMSNTAAKAHWKTIYDEMAECTTLKQLQGAWNRHYRVYEQLPESLQTELRVQKDEMKDVLMAKEEARTAATVPANFDHLAAPQ